MLCALGTSARAVAASLAERDRVERAAVLADVVQMMTGDGRELAAALPADVAFTLVDYSPERFMPALSAVKTKLAAVAG